MSEIAWALAAFLFAIVLLPVHRDDSGASAIVAALVVGLAGGLLRFGWP